MSALYYTTTLKILYFYSHWNNSHNVDMSIHADILPWLQKPTSLDLQHGFRKARSCESQLLPFIQELNASNNKNIHTDLIIMDFAKAFDKVSHRRLLYKLEYYGIQTHTLNWIQAFLSDRTQTVVIDGVTSGVQFSNLYQWLSGISYTQQTKTLCRWQYHL